MPLSQNDRVIKTFPSDFADNALGVCVLPGRGWCCEDLLQAGRCDLSAEMCAEFSVTISDKIFWHIVQTDSLNDLPCRPFCCWGLRHVRVQDLSSIVTEDYQHEQHPKRCCRYREKICGDDVFGVVLKESTPGL
jgi:hypothetical protein